MMVVGRGRCGHIDNGRNSGGGGEKSDRERAEKGRGEGDDVS